MFRALLRLVVVLIIVVAAGAFFLGYWGSGRFRPVKEPPAIGTAGRVDTQKAKEVGAEVGAKTAAAANTVGAKTAEAANKAGALLSDAALTAKIKSKMALDDLVKPCRHAEGQRGQRRRTRSRRAAGEGDSGGDAGGRQAGCGSPRSVIRSSATSAASRRVHPVARDRAFPARPPRWPPDRCAAPRRVP